MCGIAGFVSESLVSDAGHQRLKGMLSGIAHRGPDHTATYFNDGVALGNQRLKIIDLEGGDQPKFNRDKSIAVVFNGEIYNFPELRDSLVSKGYEFTSRSDTEVIAHMFDEYGTDSFKMLNGMFAIAIHDRKADRVLLARDRFGIKPLFYGQIQGDWHFCSELKPLVGLDGFNGKIDYEALSIYLSQMYIPQPWTVYDGARRLRAGHYLELSQGRLSEHQYYDLDFSKKDKISREECKEQLVHFLSRSVKKHLLSDVPIGMFLSGGVDSCSVLALGMHEGGSLDSYTLYFEEKAYDEIGVARTAADYFQSKHFGVLMREDDFLGLLPERHAHSAEPVGPWINVGKQFLSRFVTDQGLKVVLNGAGGDELFCGYPTVNASILSRFYQKLPSSLRGLTSSLVNRLGAGEGALPLAFMAKSFVNAQEDSWVRTFMNFKGTIQPRDYSRFFVEPVAKRLGETGPYRAFEQYSDKLEQLHPVDAMQYLDIKCFLEGSILFLGDNATMACSLEERVPFLENDLVDFACRIPVEHKFELRRVKPLLRDAMGDYLMSQGAKNVLREARKKGFELPGNKWSREGKLGSVLDEVFQAPEVSDFLDSSHVNRLVQEHRAGKSNHERQLQALCGLASFLRKN